MTLEPALRVAYLVSQYPALSHTFIEREVHALRQRGVEVHTFSVRPCPPHEQRSQAMRDDAERTDVLREFVSTRILLEHGGLARRCPRAWAAGLRAAAAAGARTGRAKVWQGFYFAQAVMLYERLRERGIRHVHAHFANVASDIARIVAAIGDAEDGAGSSWRWSFTMHGPTEFEAVEAFDLAAKVRDADGVACISDFCRSQLMKLVGTQHWSKLDVVRMSVDADRYRPQGGTDAVAAEPDATPLILSVGRLVPEKGAPILLDAVQLLASRGVRVRACIVGAGPLRGELEHRLRDTGLGESVDLPGPVGQDDLPAIYRQADVFVLPSFQEGLPVVLMEAMASGIPVVATQIAAVSELVTDRRSGRIVPPGRADLLADAIEEVLADPQATAASARAGREAVLADFVPAVTGAAMKDFLRRVQVRPVTARGRDPRRPAQEDDTGSVTGS